MCPVCLERRAETKRESRKAFAVVCAVDANQSDVTASAAARLGVCDIARATRRVDELFATCADSPAIAATARLSACVAVHTNFSAVVFIDSHAAVYAEPSAAVYAEPSVAVRAVCSVYVPAARLVVKTDTRTIDLIIP